MNLLFILNNSKVLGGGEYSIFKFAEHLAKLGHKAVIYTTTRTIITSALEKHPNIEINYRGFIPKLFKGTGMLNRAWMWAYENFVIKPRLRKEKDFDFIVGYHTSSTIRATDLGTVFRIPSVSFVFETPDWMESQLRERWRQEYRGHFKRLWLRAKKALGKTSIIFANSKLTAEANRKWLGREIDGVIYPGLPSSTSKREWPSKKKNQIIYFGRLDKYKNIDIIIRALENVDKAPKLVICGSGAERASLEELSRKTGVECEFLGTVEEYRKWEEIRKSLFMVFPSSFEGFGMPPMEALSCGIPCICSDIPIFREVYGNKIEYFKLGDIASLRNKIRFLLKNRKYRETKGKAGSKYVRDRYTWEKSAAKIEKVLLEYKKKKWDSANGNQSL